MCWLLCLVLTAAFEEGVVMTVTEDTVSKWGLSGPYWGVASKKPPQLTGTTEAPVGLASAPQSLSEHRVFRCILGQEPSCYPEFVSVTFDCVVVETLKDTER